MVYYVFFNWSDDHSATWLFYFIFFSAIFLSANKKLMNLLANPGTKLGASENTVSVQIGRSVK